MTYADTVDWRVVTSVSLALLAATAHARADEPKSREDADSSDEFDQRLVLDDGRVAPPEPVDGVTFAVRGEDQLRFRATPELRLQPPIGGTANTLGQTKYLYHWSRVRPVLLVDDTLKIQGEIDLPRGLVAGDTTQFVGAARDSFDEVDFYDIHPRQLYLQYETPIGMVRLGQQTSHWGMGLLANDGDHTTLFGDYRRGVITERLLFATRPMGKGTPLAIALAGDLIFEDYRAQLLEGDRVFQGIAAVRWETPRFEIGLYGVVRHQERDRESVDALTPFTEELTVGVADLAMKFNAPVPGANAFLFGELEAAFAGGSTTFVRNIDLTAVGDTEDVVTFGGAAKLGIVKVATGAEDRRFGRLVVQVEGGYASGDADPFDGVTKRFTFDQNHNVGLVLFDHVMQWKTARSATIAQDPEIVNRPAPGLQFLASEGGVFGASYLNPTVVVRPFHFLDLKGGFVIARTTADFVDPFQTGALGNYANYDGGDERRHDLGLELDGGADFRLHATQHFIINAGVEAGVLFPGAAFDDADGVPLDTQYLVNTKLGISY